MLPEPGTGMPSLHWQEYNNQNVRNCKHERPSRGLWNGLVPKELLPFVHTRSGWCRSCQVRWFLLNGTCTVYSSVSLLRHAFRSFYFYFYYYFYMDLFTDADCFFDRAFFLVVSGVNWRYFASNLSFRELSIGFSWVEWPHNHSSGIPPNLISWHLKDADQKEDERRQPEIYIVAFWKADCALVAEWTNCYPKLSIHCIFLPQELSCLIKATRPPHHLFPFSFLLVV